VKKGTCVGVIIPVGPIAVKQENEGDAEDAEGAEIVVRGTQIDVDAGALLCYYCA
jgi:hypothetical protein